MNQKKAFEIFLNDNAVYDKLHRIIYDPVIYDNWKIRGLNMFIINPELSNEKWVTAMQEYFLEKDAHPFLADWCREFISPSWAEKSNEFGHTEWVNFSELSAEESQSALRHFIHYKMFNRVPSLNHFIEDDKEVFGELFRSIEKDNVEFDNFKEYIVQSTGLSEFNGNITFSGSPSKYYVASLKDAESIYNDFSAQGKLVELLVGKPGDYIIYKQNYTELSDGFISVNGDIDRSLIDKISKSFKKDGCQIIRARDFTDEQDKVLGLKRLIALGNWQKNDVMPDGEYLTCKLISRDNGETFERVYGNYFPTFDCSAAEAFHDALDNFNERCVLEFNASTSKLQSQKVVR